MCDCCTNVILFFLLKFTCFTAMFAPFTIDCIRCYGHIGCRDISVLPSSAHAHARCRTSLLTESRRVSIITEKYTSHRYGNKASTCQNWTVRSREQLCLEGHRAVAVSPFILTLGKGIHARFCYSILIHMCTHAELMIIFRWFAIDFIFIVNTILVILCDYPELRLWYNWC